MKRTNLQMLCFALCASCTAINQKDAFLDNLPRPLVTVFSDDFESGLGQWSQTAGTWNAVAPSVDGLALKSPTSATAATFSISTKNDIPFSGNGCILQFDIRYALGGASGVSASILVGSDTVASYKQSAGTSAITSSSAFVPQKIYLLAEAQGKLTITTAVTAAAAADLSIDNMKITCNNAVGSGVTLISDNLESSASNWTLTTPWAYSTTNGASNSKSIRVPPTHCVSAVATYASNISLLGRHGCKIRYYYNLSTNDVAPTMFALEWNGLQLDTKTGAISGTGYMEYYVSAFDGLSTNTLQFRCRDGCTNGSGSATSCAVDEVTLSCAQ